MAPRPGREWSSALSHLALGSANRGAAAGFLLQALAAATMLAPGLGTDEDCLAGAWVATVIGLPLLAFDFHWVNGDCSSANLLLGGGMVLAVAGLLSRLEEDRLLLLPKEDVCRWALAGGSWAYHRALHTQRLQWG
ncbi:hypothetical protein E2I00_012073 [Balaenoptera physalus]|uniref:Uncharacterized protein n=1 Tax=Balaenoptera physalus TaxID=9770 RepID=A0A643C876_BALPH|nr:hypothetical protein E2I00_012073 [Balaenoptera physalus]